MTASILAIAASLLGIAATWFIGRFAVKWLQWYRTNRQAVEAQRAREQVEADRLRHQSDSDRNREREGRG